MKPPKRPRFVIWLDDEELLLRIKAVAPPRGINRWVQRALRASFGMAVDGAPVTPEQPLAPRFTPPQQNNLGCRRCHHPLRAHRDGKACGIMACVCRMWLPATPRQQAPRTGVASHKRR